MPDTSTLIRIPAALRDRIRQAAQVDGGTFADVIAHGLDLLDRERFWQSVAAITPDDAYKVEFATWDADDAQLHMGTLS